ncbi:alpha/beta hydrolase family protein [Alkalimonas mucilaginosa]|uniref:Alpha/beta fold hydrolase n=1 Tax=Alkalimonas mucilaginosa TaxID=3057676 RepID=A0ABU7JBJ8_9GAMM|nr:alpha/beta fold hydrolase [Alkalimonas sp. MEB004]MEE2022972.1 alpha/beta fold hydrolase [Alkalimonas sp. MEB004]
MVHGDGAIPYDAHGYYQPIWNRLIRAGYAVFSWDKPGVGQSEGQWLHQSMQDRQAEVQSAIQYLKTRYSLEDHQIGLVGFSQAGWVVPALAQQNQDLCFVVGVGFALNWMQQSWYLTEKWMQLQGQSSEQLAAAYQRHLAELAFFNSEPDYAEYLVQYGHAESVMSPERFQFVLLNYQADATDDYPGISMPFLLLLGEHDQNVDVRHTYQTLKPLTKHSSRFQIHMVPSATHSLLKHPQFNTQKPRYWFWLRFSMNRERAFADGVLDHIEQWVKQSSKGCGITLAASQHHFGTRAKPK